MIILLALLQTLQVPQGCFMDYLAGFCWITLVLRIVRIGNLIVSGVIMAVVWMEGGERRIPVQYAKRVVGRKSMVDRILTYPLESILPAYYQ